uniref:Secreted protein n=1 Tax=Rhizophora mucronata TaxID=61149 RepID=A0A2P2NSJ3_RHIMU
MLTWQLFLFSHLVTQFFNVTWTISSLPRCCFLCPPKSFTDNASLLHLSLTPAQWLTKFPITITESTKHMCKIFCPPQI